MKIILLVVFIMVVDGLEKQDYCPCCQDKNEKETAASIIESFHVYNYCDGTIAECLKEKHRCPLAARLKSYTCRLIKNGKSKEDILDALSRRGQSMCELGFSARINVSNANILGDSTAPVKATAFICPRCPFCTIVIPKLYEAITRGKLQHKVLLYIHIFPIRGHEGSVQAGLALEAAGSYRKFWEYLLLAYRNYSKFSERKLIEWAEEVGISENDFRNSMNDSSVKDKLTASKKEGLANGVRATPAFFINGRFYNGDMDIETLLDVFDEEFEAASIGGKKEVTEGH